MRRKKVYLLDTNACIRILNGSSATLVRRLQQAAPSSLRLCSVVKAELIYGARRSAHPDRNLRLLERFFEPFRSLPFDDRCAEPYGQVRAQLARSGQPIGANDLMIAATALAHGATLVTNDVGEFARIDGLEIDDWQAAPD